MNYNEDDFMSCISPTAKSPPSSTAHIRDQIKDEERRPSGGILRLDPTKPRRRSSTTSLDLRGDNLKDDPCSPCPSDRLSVTWADGERSISSEISVAINRVKPDSMSPENPSITTLMPGSLIDDVSNKKLDHEFEDDVSSILQRSGSKRGTFKKRKKRRSSTFTSSSGETVVDVDGAVADDTAELLEVYKEVLAGVKEMPWPIDRKIRLVRAARDFFAQQEGGREQRLAKSGSAKDFFLRQFLWMKRIAKFTFSFIYNWVMSLELWKGRIKTIECHFGSAIASYFMFLRWVIGLNVVIAMFLMALVIAPEFLARVDSAAEEERKVLLKEDEISSNDFKVLWNFEGILRYSPIFYGFYSKEETTEHGYRLPLAYFLTSFCVYGYSFVAILRKMAANSRLSKLSDDEVSIFTWRLLAGWDYTIGNTEAAQNKVAAINIGFRELLLEAKEADVKKIGWKLRARRILAHFIILCLLLGSAYAVVLLVERSQNADDRSSWWRQNELTVILTLISFFFPSLFDAVGTLENMHPRNQLQWQLARIMTLNLLNLYTLIFALFRKVDNMTSELTNIQDDLKEVVSVKIENWTSLFGDVGLINSFAPSLLMPDMFNTSATTLLPHFTTVAAASFVVASLTKKWQRSENKKGKLCRKVPCSATDSSFYSTSYDYSYPGSENTKFTDIINETDNYATSTETAKDIMQLDHLSSLINKTDPRTSWNRNWITKSKMLFMGNNATSYSFFNSSEENITINETFRESDLKAVKYDDRPNEFIFENESTNAHNFTFDPYASTSSEYLYATVLNPRYGRRTFRSTNENNTSASTLYPKNVKSQKRSAKIDTVDHIGGISSSNNLFFPYENEENNTGDYIYAFDYDFIKSNDSIFDNSLSYTERTPKHKNETETFLDFKSNKNSSKTFLHDLVLETTPKAMFESSKGTVADKIINSTENVAFQLRNLYTDIETTKQLINIENKSIDNSEKKANTFTNSDYLPEVNDYAVTTDSAALPQNDAEVSSTEDVFLFVEDYELPKTTWEDRYYYDTFHGCYHIVCDEEALDNNSTPPYDTRPVTVTQLSAKDFNKTFTLFLQLEVRSLPYKQRSRLRRLCWETMFGQEIIKLIIMDLIVTLSAIVIGDYLRAVIVRMCNQCCCWDLEKKFPGYPDFKIAENILHLVNNQGIVWMGMFFSPGLPILNLVKLVILMYVRSWAVVTSNVPPEVVFKASDNNNFYLTILLVMLFLCTLPVAYAVVWVVPSWHCGPFSDFNRIYQLATETFIGSLPKILHPVIDYISSPGVVLPGFLLLVLIIYYLFSLTNALREANQDLRDQLRRERGAEKRKNLEAKEKRRSETPATKWGRVIPLTPLVISPLPSSLIKVANGDIPEEKKALITADELNKRYSSPGVDEITSFGQSEVFDESLSLSKKYSKDFVKVDNEQKMDLQTMARKESRGEAAPLIKNEMIVRAEINDAKESKAIREASRVEGDFVKKVKAVERYSLSSIDDDDSGSRQSPHHRRHRKHKERHHKDHSSVKHRHHKESSKSPSDKSPSNSHSRGSIHKTKRSSSKEKISRMAGNDEKEHANTEFAKMATQHTENLPFAEAKEMHTIPMIKISKEDSVERYLEQAKLQRQATEVHDEPYPDNLYQNQLNLDSENQQKVNTFDGPQKEDTSASMKESSMETNIDEFLSMPPLAMPEDDLSAPEESPWQGDNMVSNFPDRENYN